MDEVAHIQGRQVGPRELEQVRRLLADHPDLSRYQLSLLLAGQWGWQDAWGRPKDMAARTLMLKLHRRGLITLPPPRGRQPVWCPRQLSEPAPGAIEGPLGSLRPLVCSAVEPSEADRRLFEAYLERHHYLGFHGHVGENLAYLVRDRQARIVACLLFGAAAWKCRPRDTFIGWSAARRAARLSLVTANTRFLVLPWVRVPGLASHVLAGAARRLAADWRHKYGHPVYLIETFVDRGRFAGTCYRAANWQWLGQTRGRGRQDRYQQCQLPVKDIYVYPLTPRFREHLADG